MENIPSIEELIHNREKFNSFVYTPIKEAISQLGERLHDNNIGERVSKILDGDIPEPLRDKPKAIIFRQIITPNYELRRFVSLVEGVGTIEPLFWEYHADKYTSNNDYKRSLGKLFFFHGKGKKGGSKIDSVNIIDFNRFNGKDISSVVTLWGQKLIDFHHQFFDRCFRKIPNSIFDSSKWFHAHGHSAAEYYRSFIALFIRHGVLFENFLLDDKEFEFTKNVFLPAFISVYKETGVKPLIVALEPTNIEGDNFWMCYPGTDRAYAAANVPDPNYESFWTRILRHLGLISDKVNARLAPRKPKRAMSLRHLS